MINEKESIVVFHIERLWSIYLINEFVKEAKLPYNLFKDREDFDFAKENQLILLYSMLHSVFDNQNNAINLKDISFSNEVLEAKRKEILNRWALIENPIKIMRHTIGAHSSESIKGYKYGVSQFSKFGNKPIEIIHMLRKFVNEFYKQKFKLPKQS